MQIIANSTRLRGIIWRLGRKMYTLARGDGQNEPRTNGEYWLLEHVLKKSGGSRVLLDVGANKGNWSAKAVAIASVTQGLRIHAFEPSQETRLLLTKRFCEGCAVTVHSFALSDSIGEAAFYSNDVGSGTNSLSSISGPHSETVGLTTIDAFLRGLNISEVSMVKIDTEGFDLFVLRGAKEALSAGRIEVLQFEYNWRWLLNRACLRDVFDLISQKPYKLGKLVGESIEFYDEWCFELDRFFENNYVLVRSDSDICSLGRRYRFDASNVSVPE